MSTLPAISAASLSHVFRVGYVERHERHLGNLLELVEARKLFPWLGVAHPDDLGPAFRKSLDERLAHGGFAVRDEDLAVPRVAGELAQLPIVCHIAILLLRQGDDDRLPGAVEHRSTRTFPFDGGVQVGHHRRAAIELDQSQAPRQALAEEKVVAVMKHCLREEFAARRLGFQSRRTERHFWQASRGGYCTVPHSRHCCSSKRPSAAAAVRPSATRLRAAGGSVGRRVRRIGFFLLGTSFGFKDCSAAPKAPVVVDHAEAAHESQFRVLDRAPSAWPVS